MPPPTLQKAKYFSELGPFLPTARGAALDAATLRRTAAVVRHRRHVGNRGNLDTERIQRADRGFAARTRALDTDFEILDAKRKPILATIWPKSSTRTVRELKFRFIYGELQTELFVVLALFS